ncbi:cytochrome c3 family protein [Neobacillus cucumis]|nr:cytochrome c3 family protein [Neobacillus cucumis]
MLLLKRKQQIYFMFIVLLTIFLSPMCPNIALAETADTVSPSLSVKTITANPDGTTTTEGLVSDNQTPAEKIKLQVVDSTNTPIGGLIIPSADGTWAIENITQDVNTLFILATDESNQSRKLPIKIIRPYIKEINLSVFISKVSPKDGEPQPDQTKQIDIITTDDMTKVSLDTSIKITVSDDYFIKYEDNKLLSPITVFDNKGMVDGTISGTISPITENNQLVFHFSNPLLPRKTYYILYNVSDGAGNNVFPVIKKFTTVSGTVSTVNLEEQKYKAEWTNQPHGYYTNNVNTCANCHSTHVADNTSLESSKLADDYCMACHDGTTAPKMDDFDTSITSKHDAQIVTDYQTKSGSCTACHNPHLTWSEENPNLLKDHYVYTEKNEDGTIKSTIDGLEVNCQRCHKDDPASGPKDYHENSQYEILAYKDSTTANGVIENYSLCLRCHNGGKAKDMISYYKIVSGHTIKAIDGSKLDGKFPCSECHETHGSSNKLLLKAILGHENQDSKAFSFTAGNWSISTEREFCLKCHNGKTAIYGVTGKAVYDESSKALSTSHDNNDACSSCHGTGTTEIEKALSAAHAPKILKNSDNDLNTGSTIGTTSESRSSNTGAVTVKGTNESTDTITPSDSSKTTTTDSNTAP